MIHHDTVTSTALFVLLNKWMGAGLSVSEVILQFICKPNVLIYFNKRNSVVAGTTLQRRFINLRMNYFSCLVQQQYRCHVNTKPSVISYQAGIQTSGNNNLLTKKWLRNYELWPGKARCLKMIIFIEIKYHRLTSSDLNILHRNIIYFHNMRYCRSHKQKMTQTVICRHFLELYFPTM